MLQTGVVLAVIAVVVIAVAVPLAFLLYCTKIWFQAYMSAVPVSLLEVIRMQFRKTDPKVVVRTLVIAKQGLGLDLSPVEVEQAYLQGADVDEVIRTMVAVKRTAGSVAGSAEMTNGLTPEEVEQMGLELLRELEDKNVDITFQELVNADLQRKLVDEMGN